MDQPYNPNSFTTPGYKPLPMTSYTPPYVNPAFENSGISNQMGKIPCLNGGQQTKPGLPCICPQGYSGNICEKSSFFGTNKNCWSNPCLNAGVSVLYLILSFCNIIYNSFIFQNNSRVVKTFRVEVTRVRAR
jgi:hypothetical protein